jgi:Intermediate filament tail domain.
VSYPDDVDIPVAAVDGSVVGITGPFVTSDTEFGTYSNEEFLLNVYDELLGGSGTILHDEGHGQFYDLSSFQTFAGYAESNGYTYNSTTDIQNATGTADAFVITTPSDAFSQSELDALSAFVDSGGVLFLHDQSDFNGFDATDNHNAIASAVNASFRFNDDQVVDDTNNGGASFTPVTGNFNEAIFPGLFEDRPGIGDGNPGEGPPLTVAQINEDAGGEDLVDPQENVVFENTGDSELELTGYSVSDETDKSYSFPDGFTLSPGDQVTLYSGTGNSTATELYWGQTGSAIWNNGGDTVFVTDDTGTTILEESY